MLPSRLRWSLDDLAEGVDEGSCRCAVHRDDGLARTKPYLLEVEIDPAFPSLI